MQFVRLFQMNSRQISDCNCASSLRRKKWAASDVVGEVSQTETAQRLSRFGIASYLHAWNKVLITKKYKGLLSNMSQCKFCKTSKVAYIWQNKVVKFYLKKNKKHSNLQFKISYKPSTPIKRHQSDPCKTIWLSVSVVIVNQCFFITKQDAFKMLEIEYIGQMKSPTSGQAARIWNICKRSFS